MLLLGVSAAFHLSNAILEGKIGQDKGLQVVILDARTSVSF